MEVVIDRFEDDFAIVEIAMGNMARIERKLIPDAKEGDVIVISINKRATEERSANMLQLVNAVFED